MVAPLVGIAVAAAARLAAKKLAQQGAKKVAKTAATRARANSAAAAKAVAPKKATAKTAERKLDMKKPCKTCGMIHANPAFKHDARVEALRSSVGNALGGNKGKAVTERVKIKSGGNIKSAASPKRKIMSYNQLKDMPNLIKIDSAKGNSLKKTAYRPNRRTSN